MQIILIDQKRPCVFIIILLISLISFLIFIILTSTSNTNLFIDPLNNIIVVDPGHGGIDGGASVGGVLEKDLNLAISLKLKEHLVQKGFTVILTRDSDLSLEDLSEDGSGRHLEDLDARVRIINQSNASFFLSIHVNCNIKKTKTDSAIVFYNDNFIQNKSLAYNIQRTLDEISFENFNRTVHEPQKNNYYLLKNSSIPGVIIESAFISNKQDRELIVKEEFQEAIADAVVKGIENYFSENKVIIPFRQITPNENN